jgi:hypothetical protein
MADYGGGPIFVPAPAMYPVYAPMPYSPGAPHPMFAASLPSPHHHHHHPHGPWSPAAAPAGAAPFFAAPSPMAAAHAGGTYMGSPAPAGLTPGRSIFAQYLVQEGYGSEPSNSPQTSPNDGSSAPSSGEKSEKSSQSQRSLSPGALEAAISWCAERGLYTKEPPQAIIELASLALAYGIDVEAAADLAAAAASGPSTTSSPVKTSRQQEKSTCANTIRLNARQRRTLRRALDRALAALENGDGGAPQHQHQAKNNNNNNNQQQAMTYKTPMKSNTYDNNKNEGEENEYLQMTPSGATINNNSTANNGTANGVAQGMVFGSPAFIHPQAHHAANWGQAMPMHMQMGFHAVAAAAAENAMAQISMAQQHHAAAAAQAAVAAGYMGPIPMSPQHHMMAVAPGGHALPAMYHQDQQHSMGQGAARGRMNRGGQSRFAPKVAAK